MPNKIWCRLLPNRDLTPRFYGTSKVKWWYNVFIFIPIISPLPRICQWCFKIYTPKTRLSKYQYVCLVSFGHMDHIKAILSVDDLHVLFDWWTDDILLLMVLSPKNHHLWLDGIEGQGWNFSKTNQQRHMEVHTVSSDQYSWEQGHPHQPKWSCQSPTTKPWILSSIWCTFWHLLQSFHLVQWYLVSPKTSSEFFDVLNIHLLPWELFSV